MRVTLSLVTAASALASCASAQKSTSASAESTGSKTAITGTTTSAPATQTSSQPCAIISSLAAQGSEYFLPSQAMACLTSVPLDTNRSSALIDYISPYLQFTSTLAYLKNPPRGRTLPGVDIYGGLANISTNIKSGVYQNQYSFEKDLWTLINVLPRDFHMNLPLPLISNVFGWQRSGGLTSVSMDGKSLPQLYLTEDIEKVYNSSEKWTPSAVVTIDGQPAVDYVLRLGLDNIAYLDADGIYNQLLYNAAAASSGGEGLFKFGGNNFGFSNDSTTFAFANGTTTSQANQAYLIGKFNGIDSGSALFKKYEIPATTTTPTPQTTQPFTRSLPAYPTNPVVMDPEGYTSGYYLENSNSIAVLAINAFTDADELTSADGVQQQIISRFLTACRNAGKTQLIIDLQGNGGGSVLNGIDAFKQLFPSTEPFGATRMRSTPLAQYLSNVYSTSGVYTLNESSVYQTQAILDVNEKDFPNYQALVGPYTIYGDNFTALLRENYSDPVQAQGNGVVISGYGNMSDVPASPFKSENIVLLHDGGCGSTCAVFAEMMKSQGNVRSIAVGGRPQYGPMQGVTGSKGAEVKAYENYVGEVLSIGDLEPAYKAKGQTLPAMDIPSQYNLSFSNDDNLFSKFPITMNSAGARINIRNNFHSADNADEVPLQFTYEAANCRLFYQPSDVFDISTLWKRVANVAWSNGTCVAGSTIDGNNVLPEGAYDTVALGPNAFANVSMSFNVPGLVPVQYSSNVSNISNSSTTSTASATSATSATSAGNRTIAGIPTSAGPTSKASSTAASSSTGAVQASSASMSGTNSVLSLSVGVLAAILLL